MRYSAHLLSGICAAALTLVPRESDSTEITIKRKLSGAEALQTSDGEQIEINFADGSLLIVGSSSLAQLEAPDGALQRLELVSGVFEVATASNSTMSFQTGVCSMDVIQGAVRAAVGAEKTFFIFQGGNAALVRAGAHITSLTQAGHGVEVACGGDGTADNARAVGPEELAAIGQMLGQPDEIAAVDLIKSGDRGSNGLTNVSLKKPLTALISPIVSVAPDVTSGGDYLPPLPGSIAPSFPPTPNTGPPFGPITGYKWKEIGGGSGSSSGPKGPGVFTLNQLSPSVSAIGPFQSTVYDDRHASLTGEIGFTINPSTRIAAVLPSGANESLYLGPDGRAPMRLTQNQTTTRLSVNGINKSYVTFTYRNTRFALIAGTHSVSGDLVTSPADASFILGNYETFKLTTGQVQTLSGFANGIGVETNGSAYVNVFANDLQINPVSGSFSPSGPGVAGRVGLSIDGVSSASLTLFGSAKDDLSHYIDLASQASGSNQISLASGEAVPDLNVPASVQKYGSYLDWGIIRGLVSAGGKTANLPPTPWVAGREWSPSDLAGFQGTAVYQGHALGNVVDQNGARTVFGNYNNSWDFSNGTGTVAMDFDGTNYTGTTARTAGTIAFTGNLNSTARTGAVAGKFYGNSRLGVAPDAVGGTFTIRGTSASPYGANGIVAAEKQ